MTDSLSIVVHAFASRTQVIFEAAVVSILQYEYITWTLAKTYGEKAWRQLHKNAASNIEQALEAAPHKAAAERPLTTHH